MFKRKESGRFGLPTAHLVTITFLASLSFPFYSTGVEADMFSWFGLFKKKEVYLSPEVKGVIKENGKAVAHIQVTRQLIYIDDVERTDYAETDEKGQFYFPEKTLMSRLASNPLAEQRVLQNVYIERLNKTYYLWDASQPAYKEVPEYSKKLSSLHCDLTNKFYSFEFKRNEAVNLPYVALSICTWDNDYMPFMLHHENGKKYLINNGDLNDLEEY